MWLNILKDDCHLSNIRKKQKQKIIIIIKKNQVCSVERKVSLELNLKVKKASKKERKKSSKSFLSKWKKKTNESKSKVK